jgi:hypothetical protein
MIRKRPKKIPKKESDRFYQYQGDLRVGWDYREEVDEDADKDMY